MHGGAVGMMYSETLGCMGLIINGVNNKKGVYIRGF